MVSGKRNGEETLDKEILTKKSYCLVLNSVVIKSKRKNNGLHDFFIVWSVKQK